MRTFPQYLADYRADVDAVPASPSLTNADVLTIVREEYIKRHESGVKYEFLGADNDQGLNPVYRLGTRVILQNIATQLGALVTSGSITKLGGARDVFSCNPSLRK